MDKGQIIKLKRNSLGLSQRQLAMLLHLNETGERTIRGWENMAKPIFHPNSELRVQNCNLANRENYDEAITHTRESNWVKGRTASRFS